MTEIEIVRDQIEKAVCVEDVFGLIITNHPIKECYKALATSFHRLSRVVHPDKNPGDAIAADVFGRLSQLYSHAIKLLEAGAYGKRKPLPGRERVQIAGKYERFRTLKAGDIADLHLGRAATLPVIIKVARFNTDNDLLEAEKRNLDQLRAKMMTKGTQHLNCVPNCFDSLVLAKDGRRRVNVLEAFDGFITVEKIQQRVAGGLDGRSIVWMWKRLVLLVDWIYNCGFIHGAILPPHVMYYPDNDGHNFPDPRKHAVRLIDWCYSIRHADRTRLSSWVPHYQEFYAPEIISKQKLGRTTDLYMAAKTILSIAAPDIPSRIRESISTCTAADPRRRPEPLVHFEEFLSIQQATYGPAKWHDLVLPGGPAQLGF